jgi:hypothetical protein
MMMHKKKQFLKKRDFSGPLQASSHTIKVVTHQKDEDIAFL